MKCMLFYITLLAGTTSVPGYCQAQSDSLFKGDTLPDRRLSPLFRAAASQSAGQLLTLVVRPTRKQAGEDIILPIGVDSRSVSVRSGDVLLRPETDYVFLPATNRLRLVSQATLRSDQAITITYKRLGFTL